MITKADTKPKCKIDMVNYKVDKSKIDPRWIQKSKYVEKTLDVEKHDMVSGCLSLNDMRINRASTN